MWFLIVPVLAFLGYELYTHKPATTAAGAPLPPTPTPTKADPKPTNLAQAAATATGANLTVDGKGTGLLPSASAGSTANIPPDLIAQAQQAAVIAAQGATPQGQLAQQVAAAATAAQIVKQQTIDALNTPQTDQTPEQLALLSGLASLPDT